MAATRPPPGPSPPSLPPLPPPSLPPYLPSPPSLRVPPSIEGDALHARPDRGVEVAEAALHPLL